MPEKPTHGEEYRSSGESSRTVIVVGKAEGAAYGAALEYLSKMEANDSGEQTVGDYIVAYAVEDAEGLYQMRAGHLEWREPQHENCHIEVAVRNAADGRFLPNLTVHGTLLDSRGGDLGTFPLLFLWHPWIYHYGRNWAVPGDGDYRLRVHIVAPDFPRHDRLNGNRFQNDVTVEFRLKIKTGRKLSKVA